MSAEEFWELVERGRNSVEKLTDLPAWMQEHLRSKPNEHLAENYFQYETWKRKSYDAQLWAAAAIIFGFCSDDKFDDFRGWLIGKGATVFHAALEEPDSLAEAALDDGDFGQPILFKFNYVADEVYRERAGEVADLSDLLPPPPELVLLNAEFMEMGEEELARAYPRLYAKCGSG